MKTLAMTFGVTLLLACWTAALTPSVQAGMVSTAEAVSSQSVQADRDKIEAFLSRASVQEKMQALGVQATAAKERVNALTAAEAASLAQRIDALPAGGALSTTDFIIILLIAILVAIAI
ncbi:MAG: PA2779 family protein [Pseudomonas sp.]|uniref:PA2779 family protein n=1 Tax=Pseudomonas sp. TaxID=306 RepID=UPI00271ADD50|nr:PA2779 family protein [Pseudomonas sp.]